MKPDKVIRRRILTRTAPFEREKPSAEEPLSVGVPLVKLIRRKLIESPDVVMLRPQRSLVAERFRRLKTMLINQYGSSARVIVITSAAPREGKSTIATNLALAFAADTSEKTLLLDADMRRPTIEKKLHPAPQLGLSEVLSGRTEPDHAILKLENSPLEILPAGSPVPDPVDLLASITTRKLLSTLRERYQRILLDTPPITPFTDADVVGACADGVLMVVRAGVTPVQNYWQALAAVTSTRVLGTVLNDAVFTIADWHRRDDYYYERYYRSKSGT